MVGQSVGGQMNANAGKWDFTGQKISDVKPIAAKLALHQFPDYLRNLRIARVHAIHIREMLRQTPGTMECPVGAATLRIAEHDSLQLNEVFLLKILGKIGILHREFVPRHIVHVESTVHHVGILGGAEDVEAFRTTLAGKEEEITHGNIRVPGDDGELVGVALRQHSESGIHAAEVSNQLFDSFH